MGLAERVYYYRTIRKGLNLADACIVADAYQKTHPEADVRVVLLDGADEYNHRVLLVR